MSRWEEGGFALWVGGYIDVFFHHEANDKVKKFLHDRIREKVDDPAIADLLTPTGYPFGVKRIPLDSGYFETFNLPHVHLVDVKSNPIAEITPSGRPARGRHRVHRRRARLRHRLRRDDRAAEPHRHPRAATVGCCGRSGPRARAPTSA